MPPRSRRRHLTDQAVRSLRSEPRRYDVSDLTTRGFGLRVEKDGRKWFWVRTWDGLHRDRVVIGEYGSGKGFVTLAEARAKAEAEKVTARERTRKIPSPRPVTFGEAAAEWLAVHSKPTKASWAEDERIINRYLAPWHDRPAHEISRRDAAALLEPLLRAGKLTMARQVKAVIGPIYTRLLDLEAAQANPVAGLRLPAPRPRERVLTDAEIGHLWPLWQASGIQGALFQTLLLTGLRSGEAIRARWEHLSGDWLEIPDTKTGIAHRVYLAPLTRSVLASLADSAATGLEKRLRRAHRSAGPQVRTQEEAAYRPSPWIFDSPRRPGHPFGRANELTKTFRAESGLTGWTAHDLRRTCATGMGRLEIDADIIDRCLGHAVGRISRTYNRARYERAMAEAWERWATSLQAIIAP